MEELDDDLDAINELIEYKNELWKQITESRLESLDYPCVEPPEIKEVIERMKGIRSAIAERLSIYPEKRKTWTERKHINRSKVSLKFLEDIWDLKKNSRYNL